MKDLYKLNAAMTDKPPYEVVNEWIKLKGRQVTPSEAETALWVVNKLRRRKKSNEGH